MVARNRLYPRVAGIAANNPAAVATRASAMPGLITESSTELSSAMLMNVFITPITCLLYTSDAADDTPCVDLGGRRIINSNTRGRLYHLLNKTS